VAAGRGTPVDYALVEGVRGCRACRMSGVPNAPGGEGSDHDELRAVILVTGSPTPPKAPFARLDSGAVLSVTPDTKVEFHAIEQISGR
jgi:hypothetical protein